MAVVDPSPVRSSPLVARVKAILLSPGPTWDQIDTEPATIQGLYVGYIAILAAIPVAAQFIGGLVFGYGGFGFSLRPSPVSLITQAIVGYVLSLASVFIMALIIDVLATSFGGQKNQIQAFKVAAYSSTASWVAGIFHIVPALGVLAIIGSLYSLYLLYLGLPKLMKAPQDKALAYTAVTILVAIVLFIIIGAVTGGMLMWSGGAGYPVGYNGHVSGTVNVPGGSVDLGKLDAAAKAIEANASQAQAQAQAGGAGGAAVVVPGAVTPVAGAALQALLPASVGGLARTELSSNSAAAAGMAGSEADATYSAGSGKQISLKVTDMGTMAALASLGGAIQVNKTTQTATGYEKVSTVNGQITDESYDTPSKSGKYSVMVASRFLVEADGDGVGMDDLKGAVGSINSGALQGLAKS
jgi:hypothetical protein